MSRTMKIDEEVATRLAVLKRRFKRATYSDLLESFCDFFEETRLKPTDLDSARRPPSLVITERTNRIISFIKKGEDKYLKEILNLVEKIYVSTEHKTKSVPVETSDTIDKTPTLSTPISEPPNRVQIDQLDTLKKEIEVLKSDKEQALYRLENQTKTVKEFISKMKKQSMTGNWTLPNEQYQHYKEEIQKL